VSGGGAAPPESKDLQFGGAAKMKVPPLGLKASVGMTAHDAGGNAGPSAPPPQRVQNRRSLGIPALFGMIVAAGVLSSEPLTEKDNLLVKSLVVWGPMEK
jgi:hypothetical protein